MQFAYPAFLYALAALAIPIIVHLFNFRRFKKIAFTNVRFLRDIKLRTQSQNRLRHFLILASRLLALAFVILAFAQPFIPVEQQAAGPGTRWVSVFLDNSFSMEGETRAGPLIEVAKNRAIDIAYAFDASDRFQLLTHDFEGRHQRFVSREEFVQFVQETEISPRSSDISEVSTRQFDLLMSSGQGQRLNFIISDFQKSRFGLSDLRSDSTIATSLVALERNSPGNLYVDSVWFNTPVRKLGEAEQLSVRITNAGAERVSNVPVKLTVNGVQRAIATFAAEPGASAMAVLNFVNETPGLQAATVSIEDYPVTFDDSFYFAYRVYRQIKVLNVVNETARGGGLFKAVFTGDSIYQYTPIAERSIDYNALGQNDFVILSELPEITSGLASSLLTFVKNGGSLLLVPAVQSNIDSYNNFLNDLNAGALLDYASTGQKVKTLNSAHPLYQGVFEKLPENLDLPSATNYYRVSRSVRASGDALLSYANGDPFLVTYPFGNGKLYLLSAPLTDPGNNFARHALFVATTLRMAELSQGTAVMETRLSADAFFSIPSVPTANESVFRLVGAADGSELIPRHQRREGALEITPGPDVRRAGNYYLLLGPDTITAVGLNYKREESDLQSFTSSELGEALAQSGQARVSIFDGASPAFTREITTAQKGIELWKWCLLLVLLFLLLEALFIRLPNTWSI